MANNNAPFGFRPVRRLDGVSPNGASNNYLIDPTDTVAIYSGDPVKIGAGGYITKALSTDNPVLPIAIFSGCEYYDTTVKKPIWFPAWLGSASAVAPVTAWVVTDTKQVFEVQSSGTAITNADIGANVNFAIGTGNSVTGQSGATVNQALLNTTNTLPFRIVGLSTKVGNDNASSYNIVEVIFNDSFYNQLTGV